MPDVMTRQGRLQAFVDVVREFYKGNARPPEALAAINALSKLHDDAGSIADEQDIPRPDAIAAWLLRYALRGEPISAAVDLRAVALAIRRALAVDAVVIEHGQAIHRAGRGAEGGRHAGAPDGQGETAQPARPAPIDADDELFGAPTP